MCSSRTGVFLGIAVALVLISLPAQGSGGDHASHAHDGHGQHGSDYRQDAETPTSGGPPYATKLSAYQTPDVMLLGHDGQEHSLVSLLDSEKPVMLNFIFTSCTTICPVMTSTFREVERQLGPDRERVQMVSISIDPEHDTPARLAKFAQARGAGVPWAFLTGDLASIRETQVAFDVYRGNKMNHVPMTFLRVSAERPWLRIDGFAAASDIVREYRGLTGE
jgi:protein SCO1/2